MRASTATWGKWINSPFRALWSASLPTGAFGIRVSSVDQLGLAASPSWTSGDLGTLAE